MIKNLKNKKKKGFTLIELIIVIAIIAILAAIALPKFGEIRQNSNIKADIATAKNIHSAVTAELEEKGSITTATVISSALGSTPTVKAVSSGAFTVDVVNNNVVVYITEGGNKHQVYPKPVTTNTWYK